MRHLLVIATTILVTLVGAPAIATAAPESYVALGDSYSSGLGTGSYPLSTSCKRSTKAYPYLHAGAAATFVACSGATVDSVRSGQLSDPATAGAALVTLTVGGNDIGFSTVVTSCTAYTSNTTCTSAINTAVGKIGGMKANLIELLKEIRLRAQNAKIVLLGYPDLYSTKSRCGFGQPNQTKRIALRDGAIALNTALRDAVADPSVTGSKQFVDVRGVFITPTADHSICATSSQRWINGLTLFNSAESYHANSAGHAGGYLPALRSALQAVSA